MRAGYLQVELIDVVDKNGGDSDDLCGPGGHDSH